MTDPSPEKPKLTPANQNPWYILMTLHGEQPEGAGPIGIKKELCKRNRRDWNKWAARGLSEEQRAELLAMRNPSGAPRFSDDELTPHTDDEFAALAHNFENASRERGAAAALPQPDQYCNLSNVEFLRPLFADGMIFLTRINFAHSIFCGDVNLVDAIFLRPVNFFSALFHGYNFFHYVFFFGNANFHNSIFKGEVIFESAKFFNTADFSKIKFIRHTHFNKVEFLGETDFSGATFSGDADLSGATLSGDAFLSGATFSGKADLKGAMFSGDANLEGATFSGDADLEGATFSGDADLKGATFSGKADLAGAKFSRTHRADFSYAAFKGETTFFNADLEGETSFAHAVFETHPPRFHGAKLNEGVAFHGVRWPDPPVIPVMPPHLLIDEEAKKPAQDHVNNYQRLKQLMEGLKKHEDELNFFAMEMAAQRVVDGKWSLRGILNGLYGAVSDYGRSILRPALAFFPFFAFSAPVFEQSARVAEGCAPLTSAQAAGVSLATFLSVLPGLKDMINYKCLSSFATFTAGFNTVVGALLLFLIGLALRNRFRMK